MITKEQIKILQTLLGKQYRDREERLAFVSAFVGEGVTSIKNLTPQQAFGLKMGRLHPQVTMRGLTHKTHSIAPY